MGDSAIQWTGPTINPGVYGCEHAGTRSCDHCYAAMFGHRHAHNPRIRGYKDTDGGPLPITKKLARGGVHWTGRVFTNADHIAPAFATLPKRARKRVFVTSMADLFHAAVPFDFLERVFAEMAARPHLTFQVLTKRPAQALAFWHWVKDRPIWRRACRAGEDRARGLNRAGEGWPVNVWMGATVEEPRAVYRMDALVQIPAPVRFLSVEPAFEGLDLSRWIRSVAPIAPADAPATWATFPWPDWVPAVTRAAITDFWSCFGRSPRHYLHDCLEQRGPPFGAHVAQERGGRRFEGRWIHCWNNMGRIVDADGVPHLASIPRGGLFDFDPGMGAAAFQGVQWLIAGGEAGSKARPTDLTVFRQLRDTCDVGGVPFFLKQLGSAWARANGAAHSKGGDLAEWPEDLRRRAFPTPRSAP